MKTITIVIPNFNGQKLLEKNLPKIIKIFAESEIIVIDDGSSDQSVEYLEKSFPEIKVLINKKNLGFSSSANKGIKAASSKVVFLLNNDCLPEKNFSPVVLSYFQNPKTFAVSCLEKLGSGKRGRGIGGFKRGLLFHQPGDLNKNNTLWAFGAAAFYNKDIFEKLGGFDENFNPFYWEDFDLSYRALKSGFKIYFEKKAQVYHDQSFTINKHYTLWQTKQVSFRNQLITIWKNITDRDFLIMHFLWLPYHLIFTTFRSRGAFLLGFFSALLKLPDILKKRINNKFILSDKQLLKLFKDEYV